MPPDVRDRTWERLVALGPTGRGEPVLQLAADGDWERAAVLPIAAAGAAARDVLDAVRARGDRDLALEVRWPGSLFVGAGWPINAVQDVVAAVDRVASSVPACPLEVLEAAMGGTLGQQLSVVEVGAPELWPAARRAGQD